MNRENITDYYRLLGASPDATANELHKAYWHNASRCHPDRGGNHEAMVSLVEAWQILSDPEKRSRYDQMRKYRHDGWRSRKFDDDVREARRHAKEHAAQSWAEFEKIYQNAFYTFNQDFYGREIEQIARGPYSPLMQAEAQAEPSPDSGNTPTGSVWLQTSHSITIILFCSAVAAALFCYRYFREVCRCTTG
jgi:curved DNA-binding protein CbpA